MRGKVGPEAKRAVLDLEGADCPSCAYAIEHAGRKLPGVSDVRVDIAAREAHIVYTGSAGALEKIAKLVRSLGYDAQLRDSPPAGPGA